MLFTKKHTKQNHEDKSTVGIRNLNKVNRKGMLTVRNSAMNGYEFVFRILFENFKHSNRFKKKQHDWCHNKLFQNITYRNFNLNCVCYFITFSYQSVQIFLINVNYFECFCKPQDKNDILLDSLCDAKTKTKNKINTVFNLYRFVTESDEVKQSFPWVDHVSHRFIFHNVSHSHSHSNSHSVCRRRDRHPI